MEFGFHDTSFVISVLPQLKPSIGMPPNQGYHIYFTLAGGSFPPGGVRHLQFLQISKEWDPKAVLKEFALCAIQIGTIEQVTKSGSRKIQPVVLDDQATLTR